MGMSKADIQRYEDFCTLVLSTEAGKEGAWRRQISLKIGAWLGNLRMTTGLTEEEVTERVKLGQGDLASIEGGCASRSPRFETLVRIAEAEGFELGLVARHIGQREDEIESTLFPLVHE